MDADERSSEAALPPVEPGSRSRAELVQDALAQWSEDLAALGGRDPLLHFRDLKIGTLDLAAAEPTARRRLMDGEPVPISKLFPHEPLRTSALRSARAMRDKARELAEERGLGVGLLAVGIATWSNPFAAHRPTAPVLLRRLDIVARDAAETDFMVAVGDEAIVNPVLLHALDTQLGLRFSAEELRDPAGQLRYPVVVERLREFAPPHVVDGFSVAHRAVLGTFAVEPLVLTADLDALAPLLPDRELVAALAGDPAAREHLRGRRASDERARHLVLDADARQDAAVAAAAAGTSFRIDAPPGSGRTQTVANIVAELVTRGRRVLVVGQKQTNLAQVVSRLRAAGLGDIVLDLPDLTPAVAVTQLGTTIRQLRDRPTPPAPDGKAAARAADAVRRLDRYRDALHRKRAPWGSSAYDAMVELATAPEVARRSARIPADALAEHDEETAVQLRYALEEYAELEGLTLTEQRSPWYGAQLASAAEAEQVGTTVVGLRESALPHLRDAVTRAAVEVGLPGPASPAECFEIVDLLEAVAATEQQFGPTIWSAPLTELAAATADRGWRRSNAPGVGWFARRSLRRTVRELTGQPLTSRERPAVHAALVRAEEIRTDWQQRARDGKPPRTGPHLAQAADAAEACRRRFDLLADASSRLADLPEETFEDANRRLGDLVLDERRLFALPRLLELESVLHGARLSDLLADLREHHVRVDDVGAAYDYIRHASLLGTWRAEDPNLGSFDTSSHEQWVTTYREADAQALRAAAQGVLAARASQVAEVGQAHPDQLVVAARAGVAPRPRTPWELLEAAPEVTLTAVPCWVMSPLAVPTWLPPTELFDTVIIEDAGRLAVAQAVPVLARAAQAILVGDDNELTLTSFTTAVEGPSAGREAEGPWAAGTPDSVVDALWDVLPTYALTGQYRTRDDRLIGYAAQTTYAGRLEAAPGAGGPGRLRLERIEPVTAPGGDSADADAGAVRTAPSSAESGTDNSAAEVARVVEVVLEHYRTRPHESLGVVTLTAEHGERLDAAIRRALMHAPDVAPLLREDLEEAFFVKDVERVAGDVRDAIIFSLGYGRSVDGRVLYRFGGLDRPGGEHRLAAATTRARQRLTVISSFGSEDLSERRLTTPGAHALRDFLAYVEHGQRAERMGTPPSDTAPDRLAAVVAERLRAAGAVVVTDLGQGPAAVTIAVRHPSRPDRFVLAIETDGPGYAAATARERERIRPDQLRRLGWSVHRVWSPAWAADPDGETARLLEAYDRAVERADAYDWALAAVESDDTVGLDDLPDSDDPDADVQDAEDEDAQDQDAEDQDAQDQEAEESSEGIRPASVMVEPGPPARPTEYVDTPRRQGRRPQLRPGGSVSDYTGPELTELARWLESDEQTRPLEEVVREAATELRLDPERPRTQAVLRHAVRLARAATPAHEPVASDDEP